MNFIINIIKLFLSSKPKSTPVVTIPAEEIPTYKVTREEILMGRDKEFPLDAELESNLKDLLAKVNKIREAYGKPMTVSSGYRPGAFNTAAGGARRSAHMVCKAVDFKDSDGAIDAWLSQNQDLLEKLGMWQEHPDHTKGWAHIDTVLRPVRERPNCKKRQFIP